MNVKNCDKNMKCVLISMQMICSEILQEGGTHDGCINSVLSSLMSVGNTEFKWQIMLMKRKRFRREPTEVREIISVATTKHYDLVTNNEYVVPKDSDVKPEHLRLWWPTHHLLP